MNNQFYPNNRPSARRGGSNFFQQQLPLPPRQFQNRPKPGLNFTDNFADFKPHDFHNSTLKPNRSAPFFRSMSGGYASQEVNNYSLLMNHQANISSASEKPLFSSFFTDSSNSSGGSNSINNSLKESSGFPPLCEQQLEMANSTCDDDGVFLQISNLDQWYDEQSMKHYLMSQLKPITPILSLTLETPSIAKVKVPSVQFAKLVVSHLHRKKMGHKRIFVSFMKDKTSAECSALRNKVVGLLKDVPCHQLPMSKFRELFQSRFKSSISILDLYRMPEVCAITVNSNDEKTISLQPELPRSMSGDLLLKTNQHSAPYCMHHFKPDKNKGWAEIEIEPLPNIFMSVAQVQAIIQPLLRAHQDDIPIASLLYCMQAELNVTVQPNERGVSLEHLVSCVPGVEIQNNDYGIKVLSWHEDQHDVADFSMSSSSKYTTSTSKGTLNSSCGDSADNITKEVIELIKMCPKSTMMFSKFIPTYHNHFGKQCRVADYGCTKLIEMFEAMSSIVQVLGDGDSRQITLTHRTQIRRFTTDLFKVLRSQPSKSIQLSKLPQAYLATIGRIFDVTDYGVCDIDDLMDGLRNNNFIVVTRKRDEADDVTLFIQKRRQTNVEMEKTSIFAGEVVELLRSAPQFSIPFRKFVRSYHYYFGYQCRLSDYGFMRLAELLEALSGVVEMDQNNEENRKIFLSRKVALRIFSEQIQEIIKSMTGRPGTMVKVDDVMEFHKNKYGYQMQGSSLGYDSVIDALKFVPFVELHSHENELWIVSHLENEKFRQRSILACLAVNDLGNKVPLAKFHSVFSEKFKFSINEKTLHAMKHAVEIEMVNGVKMITISNMMRFIMHITSLLDHKKVMNVQELKAALKLNLNTCFNFGFSNLSSLLQAYTDIFVSIPTGTNLQDRSDVQMNPDSPFCQSGLKRIIDLRLVQDADEKPAMFFQPVKRPTAIQKPAPSVVTNNNNSMNGSKFFNPDSSEYRHFPQENYHRTNPFAASNPFANDVTMSTTLPSEILNQMMTLQMNSYQQQQQQAQQQQQRFQNQSFDENMAPNSQSFYERNLKFQHQQHMQSVKRDFNNSAGLSNNGSSGMSSSSLSSFEQQQSQSQQQFNMMPFYNRSDPPKPDTPPATAAKNLPSLWFDPVWNCDGNGNGGGFESNRNNNSGAGKSDSVKAFNFSVISPYMSFKTMFTFDNMNPNNSNGGSNNQKM